MELTPIFSDSKSCVLSSEGDIRIDSLTVHLLIQQTFMNIMLALEIQGWIGYSPCSGEVYSLMGEDSQINGKE